LHLQILCRHLDWQVATAVQILGKLSPVLSAVEELTLRHKKPDRSSELHNEVDQTQWRQLFKPLGSVKKLCVPDALFRKGGHSQSLRLEDDKLFPNLLKVQYSGSWQCCGTEFKFRQEWDQHRLQEHLERFMSQRESEPQSDGAQELEPVHVWEPEWEWGQVQVQERVLEWERERMQELERKRERLQERERELEQEAVR
jgi:hypothetical protein